MKLSFPAIGLSLLVATSAVAQQNGIESELVVPATATADVTTTVLSDVFASNGIIMFRINREDAAQPFSSQTMANVGILCQHTDNPEVTLTAQIGTGVPITIRDFSVFAGEVDTGYDCPMPAGFEGLQRIWEQRHAEHGMTTEFTRAHLTSMIDVIQKGETTLLTPQRLHGYPDGDDRPMVIASMERHFGQYEAYVLEANGIMYIVPLMTDLATCASTCVRPRLVVQHLHRAPSRRVVTSHRPVVVTPPVTTTSNDPYRVLCGGCN
jgi:hypothetical protein